MNILVLNCGSSSIKYQLFNFEKQVILARGIVEKIGLKGSFMMYEKTKGEKIRFEGEVIDHQVGIEYILGVLISKEHGCISSLSDIQAVGHRVAHGGEQFKESTLIDEEALN
ncbi:MAG: acetate kinase, partial [Bacteroidetes bacterium]|nr:acetate kinase [Bacteroidota bacterium]